MLRKRKRPSAGVDVAALTLRLAIGPMLVYHGYNKVAGPGGLEGTTRWFESLGMHPAAVHAKVAAATEIGAGVGLTLGVASPLPAAGAIGLMTVAARTDHRGKGFFIFNGGVEYVLVVAGVALASAGLGPGRWSADRLLGSVRGGEKWMAVAGILGLGAAAATIATSYHPKSEEAGAADPENPSE